MDITIPPGETVTIRLPGAAAVRIDARHRVIAVDTLSWAGEAEGGPLTPEWLVHDLRANSAYGDFHQLKPVGECFDSTCADRSRHATPADRAALRDSQA